MAHSDALIFLTSITWIFFLFLFTYFFFVLFFLPTFYKKFRTRVLVKHTNYLRGLLSTRNVLVSLIFFVDTFRGFNLSTLTSLKMTFFYLWPVALSFNSILSVFSFASGSFNFNLIKKNHFFAESYSDAGIFFTKYFK